jgi:hypothetical protein
MGMDVIGHKPTAPEGAYFGVTLFAWGRLAAFILNVAAEEAQPCKHWFSNDWDGLNAIETERLADRLDRELASGAIDRLLAAMRSEPEYAEICSVVDTLLPAFLHFLRYCGGFWIS